jgi:colanic acid biosynthesis protein WcaH
LDDAFVRLVREELGIESGVTRADAKFLGVYEHFYDDNIFDDEVSTHYIVLAYKLMLGDDNILNLPCEEHYMYGWRKSISILNEKNVHSNVKIYMSEL